MVDSLDKRISVLIQNQLPQFVREDHATFQAFLEAYYEYMEQTGGAVESISNMLQYRDIDQTVDTFIQYFKEEYLLNIPDSALADKRKLAKHIKEFYRTKGSEQSFRFLFRLLYGEEIDFYYPSEDMLRASDGVWEQSDILKVYQTELNVTDSDRTDDSVLISVHELYNVVIVGETSGAKALVNKVIGYIDSTDTLNITVYELELENITGVFAIGERITDFDDSLNVYATTLGGLNSITVNDGGTHYAIGDQISFVNVSSPPNLLQYTEEFDVEDDRTFDQDFTKDNLTLAAITGPVLTSVRASGAYMTNSSGVLTLVANNIARTADHVYENGVWVNKGLLYEGTRTNLILQSGDMDTTWAKSGVTVAAASITAPDGTTSGKLVEITATSTNRLQQAITATGGAVYSVTAYLKQGDSTATKIHYSDADGALHEVIYTWSGGIPTRSGSTNVTSYGTDDVGDGWYRVNFVFTNGVTTGAGTFRIYPDSAGSGTEGIYPWGVVMELGAFPSSYIATTTIAATRDIDFLRSLDMSFLDTADTEIGAWVVTGSRETTETTTNKMLFSLQGGGDSIRMFVDNASKIRATVINSADNDATVIGGTTSAGVEFTAAMYYADDSVNSAVDGVLSTEDTAVGLPLTTTPDTLFIGSQGGAAYVYNGHIKSVRYHNTKRSGAFLQNPVVDSSGWITRYASVVSTDQTAAPDGTITADKLLDTTDNSTHYIAPATIEGTAGEVTFSVYAKAEERPGICLEIYNSTDLSSALTYFNMSTGVIESTDAGTASIEDVGDGWFRCSVTATTTVDSKIYIYPTIGSSDRVFSGDGSSGIYIWGAQVELGAVATIYVKIVEIADAIVNTGAGAIAEVESVYRGKINSGNVLVAGDGYSIGDVVVLDETNTGGYGAAAEVSGVEESETILLMNFEGEDGQSTFVDESEFNVIVNRNGNAKISHNMPKFGKSGLYLYGEYANDDSTIELGDYLSILDSGDSTQDVRFDFGSGDFTMEMHVNFEGEVTTNLVKSAMLFSRMGALGSRSFALHYQSFRAPSLDSSLYDSTSSANLVFTQYADGVTATEHLVNIEFLADTDYHIAVVRDSSTLRFFVNGLELGTSTITGILYNSDNRLLIGAYDEEDNTTTGGYYLRGYVDSLRITNGVARYTSNFTVPTAAFKLTGPVVSVAVTSKGANYLAIPSGSLAGSGNGLATVDMHCNDLVGKIKTLKITNPGVGYVSIPLWDDITEVIVSTYGTGADIDAVVSGVLNLPGKFLNSRGHLDEDKFLQDGVYYQAYSYVIKSAESIDIYRDIVKKLIHPAGMALFGEIEIVTSSQAINRNDYMNLILTIASLSDAKTRNDAYDGNALRINGTGYIYFPANAAYGTNTEFTYEFWIEPHEHTIAVDGGGYNDNMVLSRESYTTRGFRSGLNSSGSRYTLSATQSGGSVNITSSTGSVPLNTKTHIAITYDGTTCKIYINGTLDVSGDGIIVPMIITDRVYLNGFTGGVYFAQASYDDFRFWDGARTAQQIMDNFNKELNGDDDGLLLYAKFNIEKETGVEEDSTVIPIDSTTIFDSGPYANHGVLVSPTYAEYVGPLFPKGFAEGKEFTNITITIPSKYGSGESSLALGPRNLTYTKGTIGVVGTPDGIGPVWRLDDGDDSVLAGNTNIAHFELDDDSVSVFDYDFSETTLAKARNVGTTLEFIRVSDASYHNSDGTLVMAGIGVPRLASYTYDDVNWINRGYYVESDSENLLLQSSNIASETTTWPAYTNTGTVLRLSNEVVAPDGTTTGDRIDSNGATNPRITQTITVTALTTYTASVYIKNVNVSEVPFFFRMFTNVLGNIAITTFNSLTGAITSTTSGTATAGVNVGNGWFRISITGTTGVSDTTLQLYLVPGVYDGSVENNEMYVWGGQLEVGDKMTSYIPTVLTSVPRASDFLLTYLPWLDEFTSKQGKFTINGSFPRIGVSTAAPLIQLDNGDSRDRIWIERSATDTIDFNSLNSGDTDASSIGVSTIAVDTNFEVIASYENNNVNSSVDGSADVTDSTAAFPLTNIPTILRIGNDYTGNSWNGHIKNITFETVNGDISRYPGRKRRWGYDSNFDFVIVNENLTMDNVDYTVDTDTILADGSMLSVGFRENFSTISEFGDDWTYNRLSNSGFIDGNELIVYSGKDDASFRWEGDAQIGFQHRGKSKNLLPSSQSFSSTGIWTEGNVSTGENDQIAPDGTKTATLICNNTTNGSHVIYDTMSITPTSKIIIASVYVKRKDHQWCNIRIDDGDGATYASFDLLNGVVGTTSKAFSAYLKVNSRIIDVGNGWYRCVYEKPVNSTITFFNMYLASQDTGENAAYVGTGTGLWFWGTQLEINENGYLSEYKATGVNLYTDSEKFDNWTLYPGGTLEIVPNIGLTPTLNETVVVDTNIQIYSEELDNAAWFPIRASIVPNQENGPDSSFLLDELVEDGTSGNSHYIRDDYVSGISTNTVYTASYFVKANTRTWCNIAYKRYSSNAGYYAHFDLSNGVKGTADAEISDYDIEDWGGGLYRIWAAIDMESGANSPFAGVGISDQDNSVAYNGDGVSSIYVGYAQFEIGSSPSAYIKTEASAVSVNRYPGFVDISDFDGKMYKMVPGTADTSWGIRDLTITSVNTVYTQSIFAKADGYDYIAFGNNPISGGGNERMAFFNLVDGRVRTIDNGNGSGTSASIEYYGNGVWRCRVTYTAPATGLDAGFYVAENDNDITLAGDGVSGVLIYGAQVERGSELSAYNPKRNSTKNLLQYTEEFGYEDDRTFDQDFTQNTLSLAALVGPVLTSVRASGAYMTNSSGVLTLVGSNIARTGDHVYENGVWVNKGMLIEGADTNLHIQSNNPGTSHTALRCTIGSSSETAPDGTAANGFLETAITNTHGYFQSINMTAGATYNKSVYVKYRGRAFAAMHINWNGTGESSTALFDIQTGVTGSVTSTAGAADPTNLVITPVGSDWYRISADFVPPATETSGNSTIYGNRTDTHPDSFLGVVTNGLYTFGNQLTAGAGVKSYIATTTIAVLREADSVTTTDVSWLDANPTAVGTFDAVVSRETQQATNGYIFQLDDGVPTTRIYIYRAANENFYSQAYKNGGNSGDINHGTTAAGVEATISLSYAQSQYDGALNGTLLTRDTSADFPLQASMTNMKIGMFNSSTQHYNGHIKSIRYHNTKKSVEYLVNPDIVIYSSYWVTNFASVVSTDQTTAPDGTLSADKLLDSTRNSNHYIAPGTIEGTAGEVTFSIYAKAAERPGICLEIYNSTDAGKALSYFNMTTGLIESTNSGTAAIEFIGDGWFRCSVTGTTTVDTIVYIYPTIGSSDRVFIGDGSSGIYIWGAQVEKGNVQLVTDSSNLMTSPNDMTDAAYGSNYQISGVTIDGSILSPDGSLNTSIITATTSNSIHYLRQAISKETRVIDYIGSVHLKRFSVSTTQYAYISVYDMGSGEAGFRVDLTDGSVDQSFDTGGFVNVNPVVTSVGDGWYNLQLYVRSDSDAQIALTVFVGDSSQGSYTTAYTGVAATHKIAAWGARLYERVSTLSEYERIGELNDQVRNGDHLILKDIQPWWEPTVGSFLMGVLPDDVVHNGNIMTLFENNENNFSLKYNKGGAIHCDTTGAIYWLADPLLDPSVWTMEYWIEPVAYVAGGLNNNIVMARGTYNTNGYRSGLESGGFAFSFGQMGGTGTVTATLGSVEVGKKTHIAVSFDGSTLTIYIDGVFNNSAAATAFVPTGHQLNINGSAGGTLKADAIYDDFRFWDYVRAESDILAWKDKELIGNESGLILNTKFDLTNGTVLSDSGPNNLPASLYLGCFAVDGLYPTSSGIELTAISNNVSGVNIKSDIGTINSGIRSKIMFMYKAGEYSLYVDGVLIGSAISNDLPDEISDIRFSEIKGLVDNSFHTLEDMRYYSERLPSARAIILTT